MGKRVSAFLLLIAMLIGLYGCGPKNDLESLLTTYTWKFPGSVTVYLHPDGTGAQYDKSSGRLKDRLRWELHGNEVKMFFVDEDGESDGEEAMAATVEVANSYTLVFTQVGEREWENISLPFYREDA